LGASHVTVAAASKRYGVKPCKAETFKFPTDPELEAKVSDVISLYMRPPENAIVLCVDEKSEIQALNPTQKTLVRALPRDAIDDPTGRTVPGLVDVQPACRLRLRR
jgi:hypothetical protein